MPAQPLFDRPEPYTAQVKLSAITPEPASGAAHASARSIEMFGQLSLPLLKEISDDSPYGYRIVDGVRRVAELRERLGDDGVIDALVLPEEYDDVASDAISLALNYGRAPNAWLEADRFDSLRSSGLTVEQIAKHLGISKDKIQRRLRLVDSLHPDLRDAARAGHISLGVAEKAARLGVRYQEELVTLWQAEGKVTTADIAGVQQAIRSDGLFAATADQPAVAGADDDAVVRAQIRAALSRGVSAERIRALVEEVARGSDDER